MDPMLFIASLAGVGILIVAITHASVITQQSRKSKKTAKPDQDRTINEKPEGLSSDFAALIDAITQQAQASRAEEKREDDLKQTREWLTIALLVSTVVLLGWQLSEMVKVYGPIRDQAVAAKVSADAALKQAASSELSLVQSQRAWVGPRNASLKAQPQIGVPVEAVLQYDNYGQQPAISFINDNQLIVSDSEGHDLDTLMIRDALEVCKNQSGWTIGSVVYPSRGALSGSYQGTRKSPADFVTPDVIAGKSKIVFFGCLAYKTFDKPRHSFFCYYWEKGVTEIERLNICDAVQYAD